MRPPRFFDEGFSRTCSGMSGRFFDYAQNDMLPGNPP